MLISNLLHKMNDAQLYALASALNSLSPYLNTSNTIPWPDVILYQKVRITKDIPVEIEEQHRKSIQTINNF